MAANQFISTFNELLACQAETLGSTLTASINGITVDIIQEVPNTGQTLMADAFSEDGTTWIQCLASPFDGHPITFQSPVIIAGQPDQQVVNVPQSNHGIYRFQIGDATRK